MSQQLDDFLYSQIQELCKTGDDYADREEFDRALENYWQALDLLPKPIEQWQASTLLLTAIGDAYFLQKNYREALKVLQDVMYCPNAIGNPFIHLRLGHFNEQ